MGNEVKRVDDILSEDRKIWVFEKINGEIANFLRAPDAYGRHLSKFEVDEVLSGFYEKLVNRPVTEAFPKGVPQHDGQWMNYLKQYAYYARLHFWSERFRHPTVSLDKPLTSDSEDGDVRTYGETLSEEDSVDLRVKKDPASLGPDVHYDIQYVRRGVHRFLEKYAPRSRKALWDSFFSEKPVKEICREIGMKVNTFYPIRLRFEAALERAGEVTLRWPECA